MIGQTFGGTYKLYDRVGTGGFATVYLGRNLRTNEIVAVKVLKEEFADNPGLVERFRREAKLIRTLSHRNIVQVRDYGVEAGQHFLVMDYVEGKTLAQIIRERGPLPVDEATDYVAQVCEALGHASRAGVVHRDIKPANLMLTPGGTIKVMDFGIAKIAAETTLTHSGQSLGTPFYMAPEVAQGRSADVRSDLYSLGIVLYELLAGKLPFTADSPWAVLRKQIEDPPPPLSAVRRGAPPWLEAVVARALAKDPAARFQTPEEMLAALRARGKVATVTPPQAEIKPVVSEPSLPSTPVSARQPAPPSVSSPRALRWEAAWGSDPGMVRTLNEDAIQGTLPEHVSPVLAANRGYLFIVADGLSEYAAGEVASNQSLQRVYKRYYADNDLDIPRSLEKAVRQTNLDLYRQAQTTPGQQGMRTTLTAAVIKDNRLYVANVGDSRLYLIRNRQPEQVTRDHSWVEEQVRAGVLTRLMAESHPQLYVVTRAVGATPDVEVDRYERDLLPGDVLVLCSDGLTTEVGDQQIASHATKANTPTEAVSRLIQLAKDNGGEDNISVAVIWFSGEGGTFAPIPTPVSLPEPAQPKRWLPLVPIVVALAVVLLVGGAVAVYFLGLYPPRPQPAVIAQNTVPAPIAVVVPTSTPSFSEGASATPIASALGTPMPTATPLASPGPGEPTSTLEPTRPSRSSRQAIPPSPGDPNGSTETKPTITFTWKSNDLLQKNEGYAVLVWAEGQYNGKAGLDLPALHDACGSPVKEENLTVGDITRVYGWMGSRRYNWTVVVVDTSRPDGNGHACTVISNQPSPHQFTYSEGGPQKSPP